MNEQELKEKIVGAIESGNRAFHEYFQNELKKAFADGVKHFGTRDCDKTIYDFQAEALIAAGIGDVSELQKECESKEEAYNKCYSDYKYWKDKAKDYKHKAERADRALINTCAILYAQGVEYPYSDEEWQLQQAEKELQEER